jgi:hypothetical protein
MIAQQAAQQMLQPLQLTRTSHTGQKISSHHSFLGPTLPESSNVVVYQTLFLLPHGLYRFFLPFFNLALMLPVCAP